MSILMPKTGILVSLCTLRLLGWTCIEVAPVAGSLFKACVDGDAAYVELLINNGMSPNTCDYNQRTPLHLAASNGHTHIVHFLCNQAVNG